MTPMRLKAMNLAATAHAGQVYGPVSYWEGHLAKVVSVLEHYTKDEALLTAGWLHDAIEDTPTTYEDVCGQCGFEVADLVLAVTNMPGNNRAQRNKLTYPKIRAHGQRAVMLKLADRIVNVESCWEHKDSRLFMYSREHADFKQALYSKDDDSTVQSLWTRLDILLGF